MFRLWLTQIARRLFLHARRGRRRPAPLPTRPRVEPLEVRVVPATNTFTNTDLNGVWNDVNNWSNGIPTSSDDVVIPSFANSGQVNVAGPTGTTTIHSLNLSGILNLQGTLTLSAASTINATGTLDLSVNDVNSVVNGGGSLTITGGDTTSSADSTNNGPISISGGGTLSINTGSDTALWSNPSTITVTNSTLKVGGSITQATLGNLTNTGSTIILTGTISRGGWPSRQAPAPGKSGTARPTAAPSTRRAGPS